MAVTLTVENGSQVSAANSYASVDDARTWAANRGFSFSGTDDAVAALLVKACDYLETLDWKGTQVDPVTPQALAWPRAGIFFGPPFGTFTCPTEFPRDEIPQKVKDAQCRLAYDGQTYPDLIPVGEGRQVIREKVDVLETQYSDTKGGSVQPRYNAALAMLAQFLNGSTFGLKSVRV